MLSPADRLSDKPVYRYGLAVFGVVLATFLRSLLTPYVGTRLPFLPYFFAVIPIVWHLGLGPSLMAIGLSSLVITIYFIPPLNEFGVTLVTDLIGLILFVAINLVIVWFAEANRIARRRLEAEVTERVRAESMIRDQIQQAEFGRDLGLALTSNSTLAAVLDQCTRLTIQYLGGNRARIALVDESGQILDATPEEPNGLAGGVVGKIVRERSPFFTNNLLDDSGMFDSLWIGRETMVALAGCPLIVDGRLVGVWALFSRQILSESTIRAMESVASALALGIERKRAEENRRVEEARKTAILETALDAIIIMDHEGHVIEFNPAAERIFGITAASIHGKSLADHLMPAQFRAAHRHGLARYLATGAEVILNRRIELQAQRADGTNFPAEIAVARIPIAGPPLFTAHIRDISDRKQAEAALHAAKQDAEEASQAKDRFIAVLSHELRTPLNPILLTINSILARSEEAAELRPDLELIRHYVGLEARLIDDLLDVMRIARGKLPLRVELTDVHRLIEQAVAICAAELEAKSLRLTLDLQAEWHYVEGDPNRLCQVFWNLVKNAVKFTPTGGSITIRSRNEPNSAVGRQNEPNSAPPSGRSRNEPNLEGGRQNEPNCEADLQNEPNPAPSLIRTRNEPNRQSGLQNEPNPARSTSGNSGSLTIEVADTGIGIEADVLPHIFEAFQQGDAAITRQYGGLGLGLAICNGVIEGHGGSLTARSAGAGQGTTFVVRLGSPQAGPPAPPVAAGLGPPSVSVPSPRPVGTHFRAAELAPEPTPLATGADASRSLQVLVVEDEPATVRLMARLLRGLGFQVTAAESVAEATEWVNGSEHFDLIVSDIGLPDGTGFDLMRQVRATRGTTPGIALTGYGTDADIEQSRLAGFSAHMTKPIDFGQLESLIRLVVPTAPTSP